MDNAKVGNVSRNKIIVQLMKANPDWDWDYWMAQVN